MKLFVEVNSTENLRLILESQADVCVIGLQGFCGERLMSVSLETLDDMIKTIHDHDKKVCLFFPYIILQSRFKNNEASLKQVALKNLDYIACGDVGLGYFLKHHQSTAQLIFMNETMIANTFDAQTFLDSGFDLFTPAMDITLEKKRIFAHQMPKQALFQLCGTHLISTSHRPLLSSYYDVINQDGPKQVKLKELSREAKYFGLEDDQGFHVFHDRLLVLDDPAVLACEHGYLSSLFVDIKETLMWIEMLKNKSFSYDGVKQHSSLNVYHGLDETDKGLEAGT